MKKLTYRLSLYVQDDAPVRDVERYLRDSMLPHVVSLVSIPKPQPDSMKLPEKPKLRLFADDKLFLFYVAATEAEAQRMYFDETNCTDVLVEIDLTKPGSY